MHDYKDEDLTCGGTPVDGFCVTGFLAEDALVASLVHEAALSEKHLKDHVMVSLDGWTGQQAVKAYDADRRRAVLGAQTVRTDLHKHGLTLKKAKVEVKDGKGRRLGDHDMLLKVVLNADMTMPDSRTPTGLLSGELRCRRLYSDAGRAVFRRASHRECDSELLWWQHIEKEDKGHKWSGRVILLCCFNQSMTECNTYADVRLCGQDTYKGLWGWRGSGRMRTGVQPAALMPRPTPSPAPSASRPRPIAASARAAPRRKTWDEFNNEMVRKRKYRDETPDVPNARAVRVAPCSLVVAECGKSTKHVGEKVAPAKSRHGWTNTQCFKAPRLCAKPGGDGEWVAVESCLKQLHKDLS